MKNSLLWSIQKEASPISYLFGTMHVSDNLAFKHKDKALRALHLCNQFKAEINLDEGRDQISPAVYLFPDNLSLKDFVSEKKYSKMQRSMLKSFGMDLRQYDRLLPILVFNKIAESQLSQDNPEPLDLFLWNEAKRLNMQLGGVEELSDHLAVLKNMDLERQVFMLKKLLSNTSKFKKAMQKLCALYKDQMIHELYKRSKKDLGQLKKVLIYDRNLKMADSIESNLESACFYAVGAAHLAGKYGLIRLLKKEGIKLKAI